MIMPFETIKSSFKFVFAKDFCDAKTNQFYAYPKNFLEKLGVFLTKPVFQITDWMLKNVRNPLFVVSVTIVAVAIATLFFYPTLTVSALSAAIPGIFVIKAWMVKLAIFSMIELNILGIGVRTLGRLSNDELMRAKENKEIKTVGLGAIQIKV